MGMCCVMVHQLQILHPTRLINTRVRQWIKPKSRRRLSFGGLSCW
jgi:hypothetical protein